MEDQITENNKYLYYKKSFEVMQHLFPDFYDSNIKLYWEIKE